MENKEKKKLMATLTMFFLKYCCCNVQDETVLEETKKHTTQDVVQVVIKQFENDGNIIDDKTMVDKTITTSTTTTMTTSTDTTIHEYTHQLELDNIEEDSEVYDKCNDAYHSADHDTSTSSFDIV